MTSTAQDDWDDQHRNHELAPKEADTAEPMSAEERARCERLSDGMGEAVKWSRDNQADWLETCDRLAAVAMAEIRQAEQAASEGQFAKGFKKGQEASRTARNTSGCCCQIDDDGETILSACLAHSVWRAHERRKALEEAAALTDLVGREDLGGAIRALKAKA